MPMAGTLLAMVGAWVGVAQLKVKVEPALVLAVARVGTLETAAMVAMRTYPWVVSMGLAVAVVEEALL